MLSSGQVSLKRGYGTIHNAPFAQLLRWWRGEDAPTPGFEENFLEEVAFGLSKHRPNGIAVLKHYLTSNDLARRSAALTILAYPELADAEVRAVLFDAFHCDIGHLRRTALWGFIHLGYFPLNSHEIETFLDDADERLAALAMVYQSRAFEPHKLPILRAALSSPNPRKREYACDEIGDQRIGELSGLLRSLIADQDQAVAEAARSNLELFGVALNDMSVEE